MFKNLIASALITLTLSAPALADVKTVPVWDGYGSTAKSNCYNNIVKKPGFKAAWTKGQCIPKSINLPQFVYDAGADYEAYNTHVQKGLDFVYSSGFTNTLMLIQGRREFLLAAQILMRLPNQNVEMSEWVLDTVIAAEGANSAAHRAKITGQSGREAWRNITGTILCDGVGYENTCNVYQVVPYAP